jgi:hypothetical protein
MEDNGPKKPTIDERLEALAQSVELMQHHWETRWHAIATAIQQDAENIRALARIAEIHEHRIERIGGQ